MPVSPRYEIPPWTVLVPLHYSFPVLIFHLPFPTSLTTKKQLRAFTQSVHSQAIFVKLELFEKLFLWLSHYHNS